MTHRHTINVILTRQAVNQGDHGQDITSAHDVHPDETIREITDRMLTSQAFRYPPTDERQVEAEWFLTIRLAEPAPATAPPTAATTPPAHNEWE